MSAQALFDVVDGTDPQLRSAIISHRNLSDEAIAEIVRLQRRLALRFEDAAIRLGYATPEDIDSAEDVLKGLAVPTPLAVPITELRPTISGDQRHAEQIRTLRTELLLRHEAGDQANIMAVLSPGRYEGRSRLAAELAIAFAQLGRPTLLVDADLRNPRQHILFNADNTIGLAQALASEQRPLPQSVAGIPALALITAGAASANPLELLSDRHFEALVEQWQRDYKFVVIDTPAVRHYADGLAVATIVGRVLSLSRGGQTGYRETRDMLRRLAATQSRILGAVINYF